jgi:hypothetical protein
VRITAAWVAVRRGVPDEALGPELVAAYDTFVGRPPAGTG